MNGLFVQLLVTLAAIFMLALTGCSGANFENASRGALGDKAVNEPGDGALKEELPGPLPIDDVLRDPRLVADLECCLSNGEKGLEVCADSVTAMPERYKLRSGGRLCVPLNLLDGLMQANPGLTSGRCASAEADEAEAKDEDSAAQ
ncbi:MAG TPA: hypothetical protein VFV50_09220 [Bdellovibrionales bacterium]|nr:hypothetical protein [Bdellovibrionales bacterium]